LQKLSNETSIPNKLSSAAFVHPNDDAPVAMFSIRGKSSQFAEAAQDAESRIRDFFMDADYPNALFSHFSGNLKQPTFGLAEKSRATEKSCSGQ